MNMSRKITRNITSVNMFTAKDLYFCCSKCYSILNPLSSSKPGLQKSYRLLNQHNKWEQQWNILYVINRQRVLWYKEVCQKLGTPIDLTLIYECKYNQQKQVN